MIAIRAYWSQAEAALAKSVLDNYEIPCALLHENANLYGRAPFAMPVRLVAVEDRAEWAAYVLSSDFEEAAKIEEIAAEIPPPRVEVASPGLVKDSPWELLMIAFYFSDLVFVSCTQNIQPSSRTTARPEQRSPR